MKRCSLFQLLVLCVVWCGQPLEAGAQPPAFPGALGFGANATGGRSGTVYHVTTLADSGPGSFRDAVSQPNRIVVFDVGGYVTLQSGIAVRENITIAGQTAPGGGIGFKGDEISFGRRNNIICRHIRVRPGSETDQEDDVGISIYRARNVILDHVSIEFAPWNNVGAVSDAWQTEPVTDVTWMHCLNANPTGQQFGAHVESVQSSMAWFYTIFANSHNRNPLAKINDIFVNNVLYNCSAGYTTHTSTEFSHDIINNYFIAGPASGGNLPWYQVDNDQSIYCSGNYYDSDKNGVLGGGITTVYWYQGPPYGTELATPWSSLTTTSVVYTARAAYRVAVSQAGAWPRDSVDELVISQIQTLGSGPVGTGAGTAGPGGGLYTSQSQTGLPNNGYGNINGGLAPQDLDGDGIPDFFEQANGYDLGGDDAMTIEGDGYARIEKYINWLAETRGITTTTTNTPVVVDLWDYTSGFTNNSPVYSVAAAANGSVTISNDHYAVFTPATNFIGMGSYQFEVNTADGSSYTNTISIPTSAIQPPASLIWRGDGSANIWSDGGPSNWLDGATFVPFTTGDNVTFDDTGSNSPAISLAASVVPGAVSFVASQDYIIGGAGEFTGNGSLYKVGPGKLTLNVPSAFNSGVRINEGIVQLGDEFSVNAGISGSVTNQDTLILANPGSVTSTANISGSGVVLKRGAGNHTLSGTQTYTNRTTVEAGTLTFAGTPPDGEITNNGAVNFNLSSSHTYAGNMSGTGSLSISASGKQVTLSGNSSYTGGTTNSAGDVILISDNAAGSGPVTYLGSGSVMVGNGAAINNPFYFDSTTDFMMDTYGGSGGTWAGDIFPLSGGASFRPGGTGGHLLLTGTAALGGRNFIIPKGSVEIGGSANFSAAGSATAFGRNDTANSAFVTLQDNALVALGKLNLGGDRNTGGRITVTIRDNATLSTGTENFDLHLSDRPATYTVVSLDGGTLAVGGFIKTRTGSSQLTTNYFNGGTLMANQSNGAFLPALSGLTGYVEAGGAIVDDGGHAISIGLPLQHEPGLGGTPDGGLTKRGQGTLTLSASASFTGPTSIEAGTLALSGSGSLASSSGIHVAAGAVFDFTGAGGSFTLGSGQTISGNGTVNGSFTVGSGSTIAPGSSVGKLTFSNPLVLAAGSSCAMEVSHAPLTNDVIQVIGNCSFGGLLNVSGAGLAAGDVYQLFDATSFDGGFASIVLPALDSGLAWNTNDLASSGIISVVSTAPPVFGSVISTGNDLIMSGSNGTANASYYVLTSTNVALAVVNWLPLITNQFDGSGNFSFTNTVNDATPQEYFRLQVP